ncbi:serine/threonine-protein kinase [Ideonella paludis]|uniref:serine/threonine-protein kinase n=1 Tax=Ideonella paludis TaxID=1233411 RepID=UPI00363F1744
MSCWNWLSKPKNSPEDLQPWLDKLRLDASAHQVLQHLMSERAAVETQDFLGRLPTALADAASTTGRPQAGQMIGPWRLLEPLGEGGMSTVWLAERADEQVQRQVALKLPHAGPGQDVLAARLLRERNILASLEHRNIARLYDVGLSDSGLPYLVMEYVQGQTLLEHADAQQLTLRQRLALFQQVLRAVQYAHGKLVLHRDLKPSNILVNEAGDVKLLDFGIAKPLQLDTPRRS